MKNHDGILKTVCCVLAITLLVMSRFSSASAPEEYKYGPATFTLQVKLFTATGENADGKKITYPAIQLINPITVQGDQETPTEKAVVLMQMVLEPKMADLFKTMNGETVFVTGSMFHSDNGNHITNVLVTPSAISKIETQVATTPMEKSDHWAFLLSGFFVLVIAGVLAFFYHRRLEYKSSPVANTQVGNNNKASSECDIDLVSKKATLDVNSATYQIIFSGIQKSISQADVVTKLAEIFKASPDQINNLLVQPGYVLKKNLSLDVANMYKTSIESAGAICKVETAVKLEQQFDFDLPPSAQIVDKHSAAHIAARQDIPRDQDSTTETVLEDGGNFLGKGLGLLSIGLAAYAMWMLIGPRFSFIDNQLEKTLKIRESTRADFIKFQDQGGFENSSQSMWKGYSVKGIKLEYDSNKKLKLFIINLNKNDYGAKLASMDSLRSSLKNECGSVWKNDSDQSISNANNTECIIWDTGRGTVDVAVQVTN